MTQPTHTLPEITVNVVESVFRRLSTMEVELDADPLKYGPKRLNGKVAEARGMLTECESIFLDVSLWLQKYRAAHRTLETEMDLAKKHLYANDPEVRAGRNVADRDALATMKLRDQARGLSSVAQSQSDLEAMLTVVKAKRADLKDVQGRLRDQMKLCHEEISLGGRWGSKPAPGTKAPDLDEAPNVDKKTLRDLHEMFTGDRAAEPDLAAVVPPVEEPTPASEPVEAVEDQSDPPSQETNGMVDDEADEFLAAIETPATGRDLKNLDDLLDDLDL
ncbi:MAG: hypothetical protein CMJ67_10145 [Planctomycetaceae bacterium]|nr:hypothetical protein [Planctomycetaceae bacterium]